ncbi:MAG TPA: YdcF family protein [Burkholderiaceae bacterium]|nr:YdcF family protein [Burkholderiaceae bacterium]
MNSLFSMLGIESWKPVLTALLLPPVPWLLLMLIGARLILPRRGLGWFVIVLSVTGLWLSACTGSAQLLSQFVLRPPPALGSDRIQALKATKTPTAIIVLGGGLEPFAPEYGVGNLYYASLERLRYGVWLSRETGLPLGFSGGVGFAQPDAKAEAQIAAGIAASEFGRPLRFVEDNSRDTRENAARTVALLRPLGIREIVLVTHGWHMPRALKAFETAAAGSDIRIEAAPMGLARRTETPALQWLPSSKGTTDVRNILRELLGRLAGA